MNLLITGTSGFLGKIILDFFSETDSIWEVNRSKVKSPKNSPTDLSLSIPDLEDNLYDIVIHCAGKAHFIPKTEKENQVFFDINVNGTQNLLKALDSLSVTPKSFVLISTVAVYGLAVGENISESQPLNAKDAYGLSKILSENLVLQWAKEKSVIVTILRLPLIVGDNPPGNLGLMIKAIKKGYYLRIEDGSARRSMVTGFDVAKVIKYAANIGGIYNLTDSNNPSLKQIEEAIREYYHIERGTLSVSLFWAKILAFIGDVFSSLLRKETPFNSKKLNKIIGTLTFSDKLAQEKINWRPKSVLEFYKK